MSKILTNNGIFNEIENIEVTDKVQTINGTFIELQNATTSILTDSGVSVSVTEFVNTPTVVTPIADQTTLTSILFSLDIKSNFNDVDSYDSLIYSATLADGSALPNWLTMTDGVLSGTPTDVASLLIKVTATDSKNKSVNDTFSLVVNAGSTFTFTTTPSNTLTSVKMLMKASAGKSITVDWGDNTTEVFNFTNTSNKTISHTYSSREANNVIVTGDLNSITSITLNNVAPFGAPCTNLVMEDLDLLEVLSWATNDSNLVDLSTLISLKILTFNGTGVTPININNLEALTTIEVDGIYINTTNSYPLLSNLTANSSVALFDFTLTPNLNNVVLSGAYTSAQVTNLLQVLNQNGLEGGSCDLSGCPAPNAFGVSSATELGTKGWFVAIAEQIPLNILVNGLGGQHDQDVYNAFVLGYNSSEGDWGGSIAFSEDPLENALQAGYDAVIRSTTGASGYQTLANNYYQESSVQCFMPSGSNDNVRVYEGELQSMILTGAGDEANETGYKVEFFAPDPIGIEPDLSSYSNGYIAGQIAYIKDYLQCSWWEARYRARITGSRGEPPTENDGYGLINIANAIAYAGTIPTDPNLG